MTSPAKAHAAREERRLRIMLAPDSFKGSLTAVEAAEAMARGCRAAALGCDTILCPISDGGEGFAQTMAASCNGRSIHRRVRGPLGDPVDACWVRLADGTAVIEMAAAAGLTLLAPADRNPLGTSTFGVGELMCDALDRGCRELIVGVGGSATNDGGAGMAQALDVRFFDERGQPLDERMTGGELTRIGRIDPSGLRPDLAEAQVLVACDVTNPLIGAQGAAAVYGPQKGASPDDVARLDAGLAHLAQLIRRDLGVDVAHLPGTGAAGGLAAGLIAFCRARMRPGIDLVLEAVGLRERLRGCDLCLTGEGRLDGQSVQGKAVVGVATVARDVGVPCHALAGSLGDDLDRLAEAGLSGHVSISDGIAHDHAMRHAAQLLSDATTKLVGNQAHG